ncbi:Chaperone protein DnaJ [bioreactor metagenome]|uniref:Chaperone protein DnaJ n=1 Tax=bioreactor metagenome TaxID=1076179 RepID=A0A645FGM0_9ZZZZ
MKNPYDILELKEGSSLEEIKQAYRTLARKYHPDQYGNNPLKDLAEDKMRELNEAYEHLTKNSQTSSSHSNSSYNSNNASYNDIRMSIQRGNYAFAEQQLNNMTDHNAEWNFLMGVININKGWYDAAYNYMNTACRLDPFNKEYTNTFKSINRRNNSYRSPYRRSYGNNDECCDLCCKLWCADSLCECCGGDLISCC